MMVVEDVVWPVNLFRYIFVGRADIDLTRGVGSNILLDVD